MYVAYKQGNACICKRVDVFCLIVLTVIPKATCSCTCTAPEANLIFSSCSIIYHEHELNFTVEEIPRCAPAAVLASDSIIPVHSHREPTWPDELRITNAEPDPPEE